MEKIEITFHARKRAKQRIGAKGKGVERKVEKAWESGTKIEEVEIPAIKKYLASVVKHSNNAGNKTVRLSGNEVYLFTKEGRLVTVYILDKNLQNKRSKNRSRYCGERL